MPPSARSVAGSSTAKRKVAADASPPRPRPSLTDLGWVTRLAAERWFKESAGEQAAAIAFNALLSLAPMVLLILSAAAQFLGSAEAKRELLSIVELLAGPRVLPAAAAVIDMIVDARGGGVANLLGSLVMIGFASAVFVQLRAILNRIWKVRPRRGIHGALFERVVTMIFVPISAIAVMATMVVALIAASVGPIVTWILPQGDHVWSLFTTILPVVIIAVMLAILYRMGPRHGAHWSDVWLGAWLTSVLFSIGNAVFGAVIGRSVLVSLYGVAGALIIVLLWMFYSAQIVLFGAYFTRVYAERHGSLAGTERQEGG
jgi:membrane protein